MQSISLNGIWKLRHEPLSCSGEKGFAKVKATRGGWMDARVPGEVHLDLMRAGLMPEPLVSTNAQKCRWPEQKSWWYRTVFHVTSAFLAHERQRLVFDGLDLRAQVYLNGKLAGEAANAFVPAVIDAKPFLQAGRNELVVRLTCGTELSPEPAMPKAGKELYAHRSFPGRRWLRKPQFTYGWDWVDALPNIGIWRGVRLEGHSHVVLHDLRLDTHMHGKSVWVQMAAVVENLHAWSERPCVLELTITPPRGRAIRRRIPIAAPVGRSPVQAWIEIPDAQLWWPVGMGAQPLYQVAARIVHGGRTCDERRFRVGLRTVKIDRAALPKGSRFCIQVNGQDVFCKGGNWIPADAIIARVDRAKYEKLVDEARKANINMLRVWGGGIYEDHAFYDACDRIVVLVWQEFPFACSTYPDRDPHFRAAVRAEAEAAVMDLRHHPSLVLWCGNNENIWGFCEWWTKEPRDIGGSILYNQVLPDVCRALDPARPYWPSSPLGGERPNSELDGDCHWWGPGTMNPDINRRIDPAIFDECRSRFVSEYGVIGPCHQGSVKQYLKPAERRPETRAWKIHTNTFEKETLPAALRRLYCDPEGLGVADYILYGQMFQSVLYSALLESLRFRKQDPRDDCQGGLIWMYNDCWGETGWTIVDYYLRRKASWYGFRRACTPVKAIVRRRGRSLVTRIVNDTRQACEAVAHFGWMHVSGGERRVKSKRIRVPANGMIEIAREPIPPARDLDPKSWIYAAYLEGAGLEQAPSVWTLVPYRQLNWSRADIRVSVSGREIMLVSPAFCHGVHAEDGGREVFSDNYFDLLPGVPVVVRRLDGKRAQGVRFRPAMPGA